MFELTYKSASADARGFYSTDLTMDFVATMTEDPATIQRLISGGVNQKMVLEGADQDLNSYTLTIKKLH